MTTREYRKLLQQTDQAWETYGKLCELDGVLLSREDRENIMRQRVSCLEAILQTEIAILHQGWPEESLTEMVQ